MIADVKVKNKQSGRVGTSQGPVFRYRVWWILVKWDDGGADSLVLEDRLEEINEEINSD